MEAWLGIALAGLLAWSLTPAVRAYARARGLVDQPGARRSHSRPVARGGGLAVAAAFVTVAAVLLERDATLLVALGGAVALTAVGAVDDHGSLPVRWRLGAQFAAALAAVWMLGPVEQVSVAGLAVGPVWIWSPLAVIAVVWLINLFNFMDGADGLAALQTVISSLVLAGLFHAGGDGQSALLAVLLAAACTGFLFWNRPPASIFLGDSGSLLLGWCMAFLALNGTLGGVVPVAQAFIAVSPFVVDATLTLVRRLISGERWYTAHRDHAYQRLIRAGWSHGRVLVGLFGVNLLLVMPAIVVTVRQPAADLAAAAGIAGLLSGVWYVVHRRYA